MGVAACRLHEEKIDARLQQELSLLAKVGAQLLLRKTEPRPHEGTRGSRTLATNHHAKIRDGASDKHGPSAGSFVARLAGEQDRAPVEFAGQIPEPKRLQIVPRR